MSDAVTTTIAKSGKWTIDLSVAEKKIFIKKIVNGKEKTIPVKKLTVLLICKNVYGTVVVFSAYRHKAHGYKTRFTDKRNQELGNRGPRSKPLTPEDMVETLTPWIGEIAAETVNKAVLAVGGEPVMVNAELVAA